MATYTHEPGYSFVNEDAVDPLLDRYSGARGVSSYLSAASDPVHEGAMVTPDTQQDFIRELLMGNPDSQRLRRYMIQDRPGTMQEPPEGEPIDFEENPNVGGVQDFIRQQLAGDVVPMRLPPDYADRLSQPGVYMGSRGAGSINQAGGSSSPYLDLLNVLSFPSGRSMAPPIRR